MLLKNTDKYCLCKKINVPTLIVGQFCVNCGKLVNVTKIEPNNYYPQSAAVELSQIKACRPFKMQELFNGYRNSNTINKFKK